ncbi:hypothetical protein EMPS_11396 [Entomortierella parvispora]|uniref:Uncharacterized protein n=1 Tax=Entomortierella parvispora TaxID=205924 RepID=A0A9P3HNB3_9FUNG|nr:hypothetical protein EMPS_11396 [Entomortierella parvispora]
MSTRTAFRPQQQQPGKAALTSFTKRKPVNTAASGTPSTASPSSSLSSSPIYSPSPRATNGVVSSPPLTPPINIQSMATTMDSPVAGATTAGPGPTVMGGMAKTYEETQNELFAKLEALATTMNPVPTKPATDSIVSSSSSHNNHFGSHLTVANYGGTNNGNKIISFNKQHSPSPSQYSIQQHLKQTRGGNSHSSLSQGYGGNTSNYSNNSTYHGASSTASMSSYTTPKTPERPREPRRRINSAQFKTPSAADMTELAQVVVANATPPKVPNKLRKRASTLSLTATTFLPPGSQNSSMMGFTPAGAQDAMDYDFRRRYEAAVKESKQWEKKYSSAQNQIHYEREQWEARYGALEKAFKELEMSKTEANVDKMNTLLDTVKELQIANEVFRKQLKDAGVEPDPMPAASYHPEQILVGENLERTFLEENEVLKEKSLITNQKIACLSTEISNTAIAISQTINYVQLRYLTQMLDAAEHVSTQKRSRAMSNTFLSDMLSRGVKKTPGSTSTTFQPAKLTSTIATQTQASASEQQQEVFLQQNFRGATNAVGSSTFRPSEAKLSKTFSFSSSLLNLTGLGGGHGEVDMMYRLKGGVMDDRSQLSGRTGIPPVIVQDLKGRPPSPESIDRVTANRKTPPQPKFQYASPTTSQLRIFVPDASSHMFGQMTASSVGSGSQTGGSVHSASSERPLRLRRSSSDVSLMMVGQHQQPTVGLSPQMERVGGKYPYPYVHASRPPSQRSTRTTSSSLHRTMSQQFLSPEMAFLYSKQ